MLNVNVPRLQFEAESILAWIKANPCNPRALEFRAGGVLPVELLGEGNYGVAYRLTNFPGMVLKLCWDPADAYPLYIRAVHKLGRHAKRWMPEVYALGGCEMTDTFWCVIKEYIDPCKGVSHWDESEPEWLAMGGKHIQTAVNCTNPSTFLRDEHHPSWQWFADEYAAFVAPFRGLVQSYMHPGNALLDSSGHFIITDPWSSSYEKREANHVLENLPCPSAQATAASLLSAKNSARHQPHSWNDKPFWSERHGLKHGELHCLAVSVPSTKSRARSHGFSFDPDFTSLEIRASQAFYPTFNLE